MKFLIVFSLAVFAAVASARPEVMVKNQELDISADGTFKHNYELDDGTLVRAEGDANNVNGYYKYKSPEGEDIELTYVADALGYHPQGSHVSPHLQKVLSYIRTNLKPQAQ